MIDKIRNALADLVTIIKKENRFIADRIDNIGKISQKQSEIQTKSLVGKSDELKNELVKIEKAIKEQEVAENVNIKNPEAITGDLKKGLEGIIETLKEEVRNFDKQVVVKNDLGQLASAFKGSKEKKDLLKALERIEKAVKSITYPKIPDYSKDLMMIAEKIGNDNVVMMLQRLLDKQEILDVNLDPNLIEDFRLKTILPDEQVDKMSRAFVAAGSGGATETKQDPLAKYKFADLDDDASPNYYGATDTAGNWFILKEDTTAKTLRYATGNSDYTTNWTNRASLSYDYLFNVTVY